MNHHRKLSNNKSSERHTASETTEHNFFKTKKCTSSNNLLNDAILKLYFISPGIYDYILRKFIYEEKKKSFTEINHHNLYPTLKNIYTLKTRRKEETGHRDTKHVKNHELSHLNFLHNRLKRASILGNNSNRIKSSPVNCRKDNTRENRTSLSIQEEKTYMKSRSLSCLNKFKFSGSVTQHISNYINNNINSENLERKSFNRNVKSRYVTSEAKETWMKLRDIKTKPDNESELIRRLHERCKQDDIILKLYMRDYYKRIYKSSKCSSKTIINKRTPRILYEQKLKKVQNTSNKTSNYFNKRDFFQDITTSAYINDYNLRKKRFILERYNEKYPRIRNETEFKTNLHSELIDERIKNLREHILKYYKFKSCRKTDTERTPATREHQSSKNTEILNKHRQSDTKGGKEDSEISVTARKYFYKACEDDKKRSQQNISCKIAYEDIILKLYLRDYFKKIYELHDRRKSKITKDVSNYSFLNVKKNDVSSKIVSLNCGSFPCAKSDLKRRTPQDFTCSHKSMNYFKTATGKKVDSYDAILKLYMIDYLERLKNYKSKQSNTFENSSKYLFKYHTSGYKDGITNKIRDVSTSRLKRLENKHQIKNTYNPHKHRLQLLQTSTFRNVKIDDIILKYYFISRYPYINNLNKLRKNKEAEKTKTILKVQTICKNVDEQTEDRSENIKTSLRPPSVNENVSKNRTFYERIFETLRVISRRRVSKLKPKGPGNYVIKTESEVNTEKKKIIQFNEVIADDRKKVIITSHKIQYFPKVVDKQTNISSVVKDGYDVSKQLAIPTVTQKGKDVVGVKNTKKQVVFLNDQCTQSHLELNLMKVKFNKDRKENVSCIYETSV